jgi:hypothetical protein
LVVVVANFWKKKSRKSVWQAAHIISQMRRCGGVKNEPRRRLVPYVGVSMQRLRATAHDGCRIFCIPHPVSYAGAGFGQLEIVTGGHGVRKYLHTEAQHATVASLRLQK